MGVTIRKNLNFYVRRVILMKKDDLFDLEMMSNNLFGVRIS